jgi:hypothetical protein
MAAKSKAKAAGTGTGGSKPVPVLAQPILDDTLLQTLANFARAGFRVEASTAGDGLVIRINGMARCSNPACRRFAPREFVQDTGCVHCTDRASTGTGEA